MFPTFRVMNGKKILHLKKKQVIGKYVYIFDIDHMKKKSLFKEKDVRPFDFVRLL